MLHIGAMFTLLSICDFLFWGLCVLLPPLSKFSNPPILKSFKIISNFHTICQNNQSGIRHAVREYPLPKTKTKFSDNLKIPFLSTKITFSLEKSASTEQM